MYVIGQDYMTGNHTDILSLACVACNAHSGRDRSFEKFETECLDLNS